MTAPIWASLVLAVFAAVAILFQTQPRERAFAVVAFAVALGLAALRLVPLAVAAALIGLWLWRGMPTGAPTGRPAPGWRTAGWRTAGQGTAAPRPATAEVRSAGLRMTLDRSTGDMDGEVLHGPDAGRRLSELPPEAVRALAAGFEAAGDEESLALLLAWLDRHGRRDEAAPPPGAPMTEAEAYRLLGLAPGASREEVRAAHRRLIRRVHPDLGGSSALAALLNAARERLDPD